MTGIIRFGRTAVGWRRTSTVDVPASGSPTPPPPPTTLAPSNSALPIITGTTTKGQTLSCSTGSWLNLPTGFAYQWLRSGTAISGANGATYLLLAVDVAATISCSVTASNAAPTTTTATSATVGPIIDLAPVNTVLPALTGTPTVGQVLTVSNGTWNNNPLSFAYAWQLNGSPISGAASVATYTLTSGENGGTVTCIVTATNSGGSVSATSNALGPVGAAGAAPTNTAVPTLSGDPVVGQTLFTTNGTWSGTVTSYTYQWFKDGTAVAFATNDNYLILDADLGSTFVCKVTAYNVGSPSTPAASAATSAVANISLANAITAFTRTSTSGTVPMTWSVTFAANVYEGYFLRAQVFSDSGLSTQTQDIHHVLTHADLQPSATINLTADGLTTIGATSWLQLTVYTTSPNSSGFSYTYGTALSPTDAVVATVWNSGDAAAGIVLASGNLDASTTAGTYVGVRANHSKTSGKWYFECKVLNIGNLPQVGVANATESLTNFLGADTNGVSFFGNGNFFYNGGNVGGPGVAWVVNDIIQVCFDATNGLVWFGRNNSFTGSPSGGTGGISTPSISTFFPAFFAKSGEVLAQFTSASQTYTPPTGFTAIG